MTTTITSIDRACAWNIHFLTPAPDDRSVAGTFQPPRENGLFLTWAHLLSDLELCFDLPSRSTQVDGIKETVLAVWLRQKSAASKFGAPYVNFDLHSGTLEIEFQQLLASFIDVTELVGDDQDREDRDENHDDPVPLHLDLTLVLHDPSCVLQAHDLQAHLSAGCATHVMLIRNPAHQYLPIPTSASTDSTANPTPLGSPRRKRNRTESGSVSGSLSPIQGLAKPRYSTPPDLDVNIKKAYGGTCVVSLINTSWPGATMISGPAMEPCHLVPKAMYQLFPHTNLVEPSDIDLWNRTNSTQNCMLLDATTHLIHDLRLVAVEPDSKTVRLFAPIRRLLHRSAKKARFPLNEAPVTDALRWHYQACVIENMCALLLDAEGGAKERGPLIVHRATTATVDADDQVGGSQDGSSAEDLSAPSASDVLGDDGFVCEDDDMAEDEEWGFTQELHTRLSQEETSRAQRGELEA